MAGMHASTLDCNDCVRTRTKNYAIDRHFIALSSQLNKDPRHLQKNINSQDDFCNNTNETRVQPHEILQPRYRYRIHTSETVMFLDCVNSARKYTCFSISRRWLQTL